jgi:hypothetical protein
MTNVITREERRDGQPCKVTYTETACVELTQENEMTTILSNLGLNESQAEDVIIEMKSKSLL